MRALRFAFAVSASLLFAGVSAASCADSGPVNGTGGDSGYGAGIGTGTGAGSGTGADLPTSICLLHNCSSDVECEACSKGKNFCLIEEHRCVACATETSGGCPSGEKCSSWGNCVEESAECPTDNGVPTITCSADVDCAACDPAHQVCDPVAHKCVACTSENTSECQSNDTCLGGDCAPACPESCVEDADCAACGAPGAEAPFCNAHRCSVCTPMEGCDGLTTCGEHGTCEANCGLPGLVKGDCQTDADCAGCEAGANKCHVPIGGGGGTCGPIAAGCEDLGQGVAVLPAPFDKVTNLCSNDTNCQGVSLDLNVGKILRDLTGFEQIHDAVLQYPMHACASVQITGDKSCGVCVPCKVDSDCMNLNIDEFAGQAFGPLGAIGSAFILDQVFGNDEHVIHMYCETIVGDYGVCLPCPGLLNSCSVGELPPDNGNACHDVCTEGQALRPSCDPCVANVCLNDPYCCTDAWDDFCKNEVGTYCDRACESCSDSDQGGHDKCQAGGPLMTTCSPCVWAICQADETCCTDNWSQSCIDHVPEYCEPAYLCPGQCSSVQQCTGTDGCLADYTCGPCVEDYDCFPKTCDVNSGQCTGAAG